MSFIKKSGLAMLAAALLWPLTVIGQEAATPLFVQVRTSYIEPGQAGTYEAFIQRLNAAREKADWPLTTVVSQIRTGEGGYLSITLHHRYNDLQKSVRTLFSDREWAELMDMIADSVSGGQVQTFFARQDLGRQGELVPVDADAFIMIMVKVKQTMGPAYEEALQKLVEATDKVAPELGWLGYSPDFSSDGTYRFVVPQTWEGIDTPGKSIPERFIEAFGQEEGMKWLNQLNGTVDSVNTFMTINRQDLSYTPDQ